MIFKHIKTLSLLACMSTPLAAYDMNLNHEVKTGYVLQKGVLQLDAKLKYANEDLGDLFGVDTSSAGGTGNYQEIEAGFWFGLSDKTTASFTGGYNTLEYGAREAEIGYQEFRLKRGLIIDSPAWGFLALEGKWFRHNLSRIEENGSSKPISTRYDNGYGITLSHSIDITPTWDLHSHLGFQKALEDNSTGQSHIEVGVGLSKFWERYRADFYLTHRSIDGNEALNLDDQNNSLYLGVTRHFNDQWNGNLGITYTDNLFRGIWPFMDQEMSNVSIEEFGYVTLGFTYRTKY